MIPRCHECGKKVSRYAIRCQPCANIHRKGTYTLPNLSIKMMGNKNKMWKGDNITKMALHQWVNNNINIDKICDCGATDNIDLSNIGGVYNRDFKNWKYQCRKCHMLEDKRMENLKRYKRKLSNKLCPYCRQDFRPRNTVTKYCSHHCANMGRME